jgi:hypothetical protein
MLHDNMPKEVVEAMCIKMMPLVGKTTMDRYNDITARYPEYFPWEALYKTIPQEVHQAYINEKYPPIDFSKIKPSKGLWYQMNKKSRKKKQLTPTSLTEMFKKLFDDEAKYKKKREAKRKKAKKLWDKYYKPYKLEYRG